MLEENLLFILTLILNHLLLALTLIETVRVALIRRSAIVFIAATIKAINVRCRCGRMLLHGLLVQFVQLVLLLSYLLRVTIYFVVEVVHPVVVDLLAPLISCIVKRAILT